LNHILKALYLDIEILSMELPDHAFARFPSETPGEEDLVGVMINHGEHLAGWWRFSNHALKAYKRVMPGFSIRDFRRGLGPRILRTDRKMIEILQTWGSDFCSTDDCHIIVKLIPWKYRNRYMVGGEGTDAYNEQIALVLDTLPFHDETE
jgi:hypothetical protein